MAIKKLGFGGREYNIASFSVGLRSALPAASIVNNYTIRCIGTSTKNVIWERFWLSFEASLLTVHILNAIVHAQTATMLDPRSGSPGVDPTSHD